MRILWGAESRGLPISLPYAGVNRIRFEGVISGRVRPPLGSEHVQCVARARRCQLAWSIPVLWLVLHAPDPNRPTWGYTATMAAVADQRSSGSLLFMAERE